MSTVQVKRQVLLRSAGAMPPSSAWDLSSDGENTSQKESSTHARSTI